MEMGFFFCQTVISHRCVTQILTQFSENLSDCLRTYTFFQQDSTTCHTANNSMYCTASSLVTE